jgi:hypothetical protein
MKISLKEMPFAIPRSGFSVTKFVLACQYTDKAQIYKREKVLNFKTTSNM